MALRILLGIVLGSLVAGGPTVARAGGPTPTEMSVPPDAPVALDGFDASRCPAATRRGGGAAGTPLTPATTPATTPEPGDAPVAVVGDDPAASSGMTAAAIAAGTAPLTWIEFELAGTFFAGESPATVRALLAPTIERHHALTPAGRDDIAKRAAAFGYHLVGIGTRDTAGGTHAVIHVVPLPRVRTIKFHMKQSLFASLLEDEVQRRMSVRVGSYLPWGPFERECVNSAETRALQELLFDEGYYDAQVVIKTTLGIGEAKLEVTVDLGSAYSLAVDQSVIGDAGRLAIGEVELRDQFRHRGTCLLGKYACIGKARFQRAQLQSDVQHVTELFRSRGYPEARVHVSDNFDRRTKTVRFVMTVDQRRRLDVVFEGFDSSSVATKDLRAQLTFNGASSSDDVEAHESARALTAYLQGRGFFDAHVTWTRERFAVFDRIVYRIEQGKTRQTRTVEITGNTTLTDSAIAAVLGTQPSRQSLFGGNNAVTSTLLAGDVDRVVDLYRSRGYRDARVRVVAAPDPAGLDSAAIAGALAAARQGDGLYVRFVITEGLPTLVTEVDVTLGEHGDEVRTPDERVLCREVLHHLADLYQRASIAQPVSPGRCVGVTDQLPFQEDDAALIRDQLRELLFGEGRPRAEVAYEPAVIGARRIAAKYTLSKLQELRFGKIVVRGNFRTRDSVILNNLGVHEGQPLTQTALAEAARKLRNMSLFDSVNIVLPDLDTTSTGAVNAVVDVTERYDYGLQFTGELGYSSYNGLFGKVTPSIQNIGGIGIALDTAGTLGFDFVELLSNGRFKLKQLALESTLRIPKWLTYWSPVDFSTELSAFHRRQDTPRFGLLRTTGTTLALSHTKDTPRLGTRPAHSWTVGVEYDYRSRQRNIDAIREVGASNDESQAPVTTVTGSVGGFFTWEQRTNKLGILQPLAPESGFRFDLRGTYASPYLLGQDTFVKLSVSGSKYYSPADNLVIRFDLRYDHGIPLFGPALLPEVERFFAGGDSTVRGYDDDRLKTEVILVDVPPFDNVQQIRILPAGGNIRAMTSIDAQLRIWKYFATAVFADAGVITNQWDTVTSSDIRPSLGMALARFVTPFGSLSLERAIPLRPQLGDDPRGRWHFSFAARAQF